MQINFRAFLSATLGVLMTLTPLAAYADHSAGVSEAAVNYSAMIHEESECQITSDLYLGVSGAEVRCLQSQLIEAGLLTTSATGYFGPMTKTAVATWQSQKGITASGYFGAISRNALTGGMTTSGSPGHPFYDQLEQSHQAMMAAFMSTSSAGMSMDMPDKRKVIAVVLYDGFELLDAAGPIEMLGQLYNDYRVVTVAKQKGEIKSGNGTKVVADYSFSELKDPYIVVIPGGLFGTIAASKDSETIHWLQEADKTTKYTTSVCTGAWILGAAGLLKGREASTHWTGADYLEDFGVKYTGKRFTIDGKYITAAGVSAGIDMSLKIDALLAGDDAAKAAQLGVEYDPQPPFDAGSPEKADSYLVKIMRDMMKDHLTAAKMMYGTSTTATVAATTMAASTSTDMHGMADMHMHSGFDVSAWSSTPSVSVQAHLDSMGGWNLEITTQNFTFAPQHVGGVVLPNEGHAHVYIDGKKVGRAYGNWYNLPLALFQEPGRHEIRVTLNANDHSDLASKGMTIEAKTEVTK